MGPLGGAIGKTLWFFSGTTLAFGVFHDGTACYADRMFVMTHTPLTDGSNGDRDLHGRFASGNAYGHRGSPHAAKVASWRSALTETVTVDDMAEVFRVLVERAKAGESWAVKELFDRTLGKPQEADLIERLDRLEAALELRGAA